jgi:hypothetical protein
MWSRKPKWRDSDNPIEVVVLQSSTHRWNSVLFVSLKIVMCAALTQPKIWAADREGANSLGGDQPVKLPSVSAQGRGIWISCSGGCFNVLAAIFNRRIVFVRTVAKSSFRLVPNDLVGRPLCPSLFAPPDDRLPTALRYALSGEQVENLPLRIRHSNGQDRRWLSRVWQEGAPKSLEFKM